MSKDPAFLFYPNDYIGGTMGMTFEEKGAYMELLMMQFNRGHMTTHMIGQTVGQLWDTIKVKFSEDSKGMWYNERLEEEQEKRRKFTDSRRNNVSGNNQHSKKDKTGVGHMTSHMENVNEDVNVVKKRKCLMKNSGIEIKDVKAAFLKTEDLSAADAKYYFNAASDWSDAGGNLRTDWIATIRSFARRDSKDGKLKLSIHKAQTGSNLGGDKLPDDYGVVSETATQMPPEMKKRITNIGKG